MSTLAEFRTAISGKIGLENSVTGDQGAIDNWVNEGVVDVLMRTNCKVQSAELTLTSGAEDYTMDTDILKIMRAVCVSGGQSYDLEERSPDDILSMRNSGNNTNVSPAAYYAVYGSDLFLIFPTPASDTDTVTFYYVPRPGVLSTSASEPTEIPSEFHKAIEFYALCEAADYVDDGTSQMGARYQQQYEMWIKKIKRWVGLKGGHKRPRANVISSHGLKPFHDRSIY